MQQGSGEVVEGALATMAPVAFAPRAILVCTPLSNVVTLTSRTLQRTILPPQRTDIGLALFGVEEVVQMREYRHGCESPSIVNRFCNGWEILTRSCRFYTPTNRYKLSEPPSLQRLPAAAA